MARVIPGGSGGGFAAGNPWDWQNNIDRVSTEPSLDRFDTALSSVMIRDSPFVTMER